MQDHTARTTTQDEAYRLSGLRLSLDRESILDQLWDIAAASKLAAAMAEDLAYCADDRPEYVHSGAVRSISSLIYSAALGMHARLDDIAIARDQDQVRKEQAATEPTRATSPPQVVTISQEAAEALDSMARDLGGAEWSGKVASSLILDAMEAENRTERAE